jgi:long-subunit acyl-CoA synthetase (AMP-forming)
MSETTCGVCAVPAKKTLLMGCVGVVMPQSEIMLVGDEGKEVPVGERGELYVRGPRICDGIRRRRRRLLGASS